METKSKNKEQKELEIPRNMRGLQPGPINTFPKWKDLGRFVRRGERALTLCMPITCKRREENSAEEHTFTSFVYKARWFVFAQTDGQELESIAVPEWDADRALSALSIERVPFDHTDGNVQGFSRKRQIAINPLAQLPHKTLFHETAHSILHSSEADFADTETTPRSLCEVEAEAVALLCCESLASKEPLFVAVTFKIGSPMLVVLIPKRYRKRAPKKSSAPPIKSSAPDALKSIQ